MIDYKSATKIKDNLVNFRKLNNFQTGLISLLASMKIEQHESNQLRTLFEQMDANQDGYLSEEEVKNGFGEIVGELQMTTKDWREVWDMMDINGDGRVDYDEFITASANRDKMINDKNIKMLFEMFDTDGSGYIDAAELKNVFNKCYATGNDAHDEKIFEDLMLEVDKNGDLIHCT